VSGASNVPGNFIPVNQVSSGDNSAGKPVSMQMLFTDESFIKTLQMQIIAGQRFFKRL
jgi:hypothetical protein